MKLRVFGIFDAIACVCVYSQKYVGSLFAVYSTSVTVFATWFYINSSDCPHGSLLVVFFRIKNDNVPSRINWVEFVTIQ